MSVAEIKHQIEELSAVEKNELLTWLAGKKDVRDEQRAWDDLYHELEPGITADESQFVSFDLESVIQEAHDRNLSRGA